MPHARVLLSALLPIAVPAVAAGLTLQQLPDRVRTANRDVQVARLQEDAARSEQHVAISRYFPSLSLKASYTRLNDDLRLKVGPKTFFFDVPPSTTIGLDVDLPALKLRDKDIYNAHFLLTQPLYAGGRITAGKRAADAKADEARLSGRRTETAKITEAVERYWKCQLAAGVLAELIKIEEIVARLEHIADVLVKTDMAPRFQLLQIRVAKSEAAAKRTAAAEKKTLAELALRSTLAFGAADPLTIDSALRRVKLPAALEPLLARAKERREEFGILKAKATQAEALKTAETGKMLPTVYAFGQYELIPSQLTPLQPVWAAGVGIEIPLTAALAQLPERAKAVRLAEQVELLRHKAEQDIPLQVNSFYAEAVSKHSELASVEEAAALAAEAMRLAEIRFKAGHGSALEVLQSNAELEKTRVRRWQSLEAYNAALVHLYQASGSLDDYFAAYADTKESTE